MFMLRRVYKKWLRVCVCVLLWWMTQTKKEVVYKLMQGSEVVIEVDESGKSIVD